MKVSEKSSQAQTKTCEDCGIELTGRRTVRCKQCTIMQDPSSSQCPFCLEYYYAHGGKGTETQKWFHAKSKCS